MMAQAHNAQKQPQDPYAQRAKKLASLVQRLRGWVGSDPSRATELADALIQLTEHRLLGHGYAAAAEDAQDAVRRAAELLAAKGPIGPYTSVSDAARYVTAVVHLAAVQAGLGVPDAAGKTVESLKDIQEQLGESMLRQLHPRTAIWALACGARAGLAAEDIAAANAYVDAALARLSESGLGNDPDSQYLAMDVDWLASDSRWAAGRVAEAVEFLHAAKDRYEGVVEGRLDQPARLNPALLDRLAEPLFSLYKDMADRLGALGEVDLGLVTRRRLVELLRGLTGRLGDPARVYLASALNDLADDLLEYGRVVEADAAAGEAAAIAHGVEHVAETDDPARRTTSRGTHSVTWTPLPPTAAYAATTSAAANRADLATLQAERQRTTAAWLHTERVRAHQLELELMAQARIEAERREVERLEAERAAAAQLAAERARLEEAERLEAERRAAADEAERLERKRRREERIEAHRLEVERREAEQREAERREAERRCGEQQAGDPADAERQELERLQAEIDELERAEKRGQAETE
ncbi:MAG TPA: hypothetical protein VJ820_15325 [Propionibacteriaceae bacterium]|nr:hypothetical protein [Propionibacteriaceae bacterium]